MTEAQVGFLYNIAAAVSRSENDQTKNLLKSYYLMRCKDITRGYGLPDKYFSSKIRCPNCCIEWKSSTEIHVGPVKLSKRQKQRLKSHKIKKSRKAYVRCRNDLLHSNEVKQICSFCKQSTVTAALKPKNSRDIKPAQTVISDQPKGLEKAVTEPLQKPETKNMKRKTKKKEINVYANALDVFCLQNKNNSLTVKEKPKVINNNKKRKDKFAGLCQKAVLASSKLKEQKKNQNKLSLFLKPSS